MKIQSKCLVIFLCCLPALAAASPNTGEIVFSKSVIDPTNPAGLVDQFEAGDHIHAVAYFNKSILGLEGKESATKVIVEVFLYELKAPLYDYQDPSEVQLEFGSLTLTGAALKNNFLVVDIVPEPGTMTAYGNPDFKYKKFGDKFDGPVKYAERLSKLEPGEHEIIVKVRCNYDFPAEGRFILSGDDYTAFQAKAKDLNAAAAGLKTKDTVMPKAVKTDKTLEDQMVAAFIGSQTYQDRIKGEVLRIVIIDPDWMIRRHPVSGIILHRYIRAGIAVKNDDGTCTLWQLVTFQEDYVSGKYQPLRFDGVGDPLKIPCGNVQK